MDLDDEMEPASSGAAGAEEPSARSPECGIGDDDTDMAAVENKRPIQELYAHAVKEVKQAKREDANDTSKAKRGRSPQRRWKGDGRGRSPCKRGHGKRILDFTKEMASREAAKRDQLHMRASSNDEDTAGADRRVSLSPKRRADHRWPTGRGPEEGSECDLEAPPLKAVNKARSLSPKRRSKDVAVGGTKSSMQKFMHQYLTAFTGKPTEKDGSFAQGMQKEEDRLKAQTASLQAEAKSDQHMLRHEQSGWTKAEEERGFVVTKVTSPKDKGESLTTWLKLLGGTEVTVAANGHCGWLAYYAALYNKLEGVARPSAEVVSNANMLKKRVLNEMLANIVDETQLHPDELRAEADACGCSSEASDTGKVCAVANHVAEQRAKSVRTTVHMHYWVRPMHLKAMACHARETIYVLDVQENDIARMQAYAYHDVRTADGELLETGTVCPVPTAHEMALLSDLIGAGIRLPVMILRWGPAGNHFQEVHYEDGDHANYARNIAAFAAIRNRILVEHGWKAMDSVEYDPVKTAHAAKETLTKVRRQAKTEPTQDEPSGLTSGSQDNGHCPMTEQ
jgi:hypothetical protein